MDAYEELAPNENKHEQKSNAKISKLSEGNYEFEKMFRQFLEKLQKYIYWRIGERHQRNRRSGN